MTDREIMLMALDALLSFFENDPKDVPAIKALRDRLAQPEQEPVAWRCYQEYEGWQFSDEKPKYKDSWQALYTAPVHAIDIPQERVDETAKRKHEWVDLTKAEFQEAVDGLEDLEDCWIAIQAKLKGKNCD